MFLIRAVISVVPQEVILFNETILYNIAYGGFNPEVLNVLVLIQRTNVSI